MKKALVATAILCALAPAAWGQSKAPVRIGVINPAKTLVGKQGIQGATIAADLINQGGGILGGRKIELVVYDTNFAPAEGVSAVQRLLTQDDVKIVTGEVSSSVALAVIPVVEAEGALFIATVPKHPDVTKSSYNGIFRLNSTTDMDSASFDAYLTKAVRPGKVAVLAENSDFGRLTIANIKKLFGNKVVYADTYGMQQNDFNAMVTNARASGADMVCIAGSNMEQYGNILRALSDLKFDGKRCIMPGILNSEGVRIAGAAAEGAFSADIYLPTLGNSANAAFVAAYKAKYGNVPEKIELLGFESVTIAAKAMDQAGTATDVKKIADAIRKTTWKTPRGTVHFDASGQAVSGGLIMIGVKNGALAPLGK
ncbi:MAG: ABC transporter substrate-binding protein [Proteobacteria bacterium]|nr:ABC transporter substrate-binding protein [Pseudomonadota bacterium]